MFNDEESDEEDSKYSKKKDIFSSAPMGFVSAGTLEDARNKNPTTVEEEEEETPRSRGGNVIEFIYHINKIIGLGSTNIKGYTKVKQQQEPEFEKFSKGIGSKLLKSMGWTVNETFSGVKTNFMIGWWSWQRRPRYKISHRGES